MIKKNDMIELTITDLTSEASGVGRFEGVAIFVPMAAVGDLLCVRIVKVLKNYCFGIIEKIITPSTDRIELDCPIFRRCGGCDFRHIRYEAELTAKARRVSENMRRIGGVTIEALPPLPSPEVDRYRNKAIFPVQMQNGKLVIGFYEKRSHEVIDCTDCMLHPASFQLIVAAVREYIIQNNVSIYDELTHTGLVRSLYIRKAFATNEIMVCLITNGNSLPAKENFITKLSALDLNISSIMQNVNTQKNNVLLGESCITLWGKPHITDLLCDLTFNISPLSFYQVNRAGAEKLYELAINFAQLTGTETIVDLYCGAGTIGLSMAHNAKQLIGVDNVAAAIANAKENAIQNNITNATFYCDDAADAAKKLEAYCIKPDVVIIDPPRKGCAPELIETIANMNPNRVIMVSCDPATAARDVAIFEKIGYRVNKFQAVDMFPRTNHVECVVKLCRVEK